jgi:putative acetyltransferase
LKQINRIKGFENQKITILNVNTNQKLQVYFTFILSKKKDLFMDYYLIKTNAKNADFQVLVAQLDAHFSVLNGEKDAFYSQYNQLETIKYVVIAYQNGQPIGCGAIKEYSPNSMEIKRMYVLPALRGQGIASSILRNLERWAVQLGYSETILETLKSGEKVIATYAKNGYQITANYGQYEGVETSICMNKKL